MKSLILAAGYATRLYPLTKNFPKPLLKVGGITILDRLISDIDKIEGITQHIIVTNNSFYEFFAEWKRESNYKNEILIVNDGTTTNENRLGASKDILFAIEKLAIEDDLLVLAGDNVTDFSFSDFVKFALQKSTSCITCHYEPRIMALQKTGVLEIDNEFKVLAMYEKPSEPPSHWAVPPFYYYKYSDLALIRETINEVKCIDAPGNLISLLCKKTPFYAWEINGNRFDIGDLESYQSVNEIFEVGTNVSK
jgi:glucose-1-phosphate thymidylyltransferase